MKKILIIAIITPMVLFSKIHYAKVEPYDSVVLKSSVSALVISADIQSEGQYISNHQIIQLDDKMDKIDLNISKEMLKLNQIVLKNAKKTFNIKNSYFNRINALNTTSKTQKDNANSSYLLAQNQYLTTKEKVLSLKYKIAKLEDSISKKNIILSDKYLYKLFVKKGDFVNFGSPLASVINTSKAKLVLFLESEEIDNLGDKKIFLDEIETDYKIDRVWSVTDEKFISSYKAWIIIEKPKDRFSKLIKVELK
jgi:hypothetical protein